MKDYIPHLKNTGLFAGLDEKEAEAAISCMGMTIREYKKGEYVHRSGEFIKKASVLMEGSLLIQRDDYWGNRSILGRISTGDIFGEAYAAQESVPSLNDVIAEEHSAVLAVEVKRLLSTCANACHFHARLISNLLLSISEKNRLLTQKLNFMSKRTTREKLLSYLSAQSQHAGNSTFKIPFNRQQLADYLAVDRSAMSSELSRMRDDGLLSFDKNSFRLFKGFKED